MKRVTGMMAGRGTAPTREHADRGLRSEKSCTPIKRKPETHIRKSLEGKKISSWAKKRVQLII